MVQPDEIAENGDADRRIDHRGIAEELLAREGRGDFGEDTEQRQDQDIDLRVAPYPDQVHIHHRRAAEVVGEEIGPDIAIEAEQRERRSEEHTSELQSLMRISYAVFRLQNNTQQTLTLCT